MRRTLEMKRIEIGSLFKLAFVLYAILGLVAGLCFALVFMVLGQLGSLIGEDTGIPGLGVLSGMAGVVAIPMLAMFYGVMGSIVITVIGTLYNIAAGRVGGLKFEFETGEVAAPAPSSQA